MFNMFAGGAVQRMAIFALNIMPYISASIIMQLMTSVFRRSKRSRRKASRAARSSTSTRATAPCVLALFQAYGIAVGLEGGSGSVVTDPGLFFRISTVITLTGGTMFLMWLGEQITSRGIGNGISLIIFPASSRACRRRSSARWNSAAQGAMSTGLILASS